MCFLSRKIILSRKKSGRDWNVLEVPSVGGGGGGSVWFVFETGSHRAKVDLELLKRAFPSLVLGLQIYATGPGVCVLASYPSK